MKNYDDEYNEHEGCAVAACVMSVWVAIVAACIVFFFFLTGCTNTKYVPVERVRTERVEADTTAIYNRLLSYFEAMRQKETSRDSLIDHTKETVILKENGDTARHDRERIVYRASHREKELERELRQRDSVVNDLRTQLQSVKADSIPVPYPVERKLSWWEQTKMDLGGFALAVIAAALCVAVVWVVRRGRRR